MVTLSSLNTPRPDLRVIIIGAGTGGLCLAHGLKRAGIDVAVFERDRTRTDGLQGYRVGIDADGSRALHACLPPEVFAIFLATCARPPRHFNLVTERLDELLSLDIPLDTDPVTSEKSVSRMTLRQVLLTGLDDVVHFDKTFSHFAQHPDGTVTAWFTDGSSATADLLVGADGTNSPVRRQYLPHARLRDSGIIGIAGKIPLTGANRRLLPEKIFQGVTMVLAQRGFFSIIHVMEFPWRDSTPPLAAARSDRAMLERWPGLQFDNTCDYLMWGMGGAARNLPADTLHLRGEPLLQIARDATRAWSPTFRELQRQTDPSTCFPINIRTSEQPEAWPASNVTLIGDAIHTMTPGRGVGANTALRDAALLCQQIVAARDGDANLISGVAAYEAEMRAYAFAAVEKSLEQMDGRALVHRPVVGRAVTELSRAGLRVVNHLQPVKKRLAASLQQERGAARGRDVRAA
ncbi:MAG: FAD-dependent monooxygenase [Thermomicrobiales bacterium]|nr:FAD-dependent monooxygenase [Thermomicrobiales bacterium]